MPHEAKNGHPVSAPGSAAIAPPVPAMNASVRRRASWSVNCTGGVFMK